MTQQYGYASTQPWMGEHPDIVALRERFEVAAESAQSQAVEGVLMLAGLWAAISPWVVGFRATAPDLAVSNLIVGLAVALLAFSYGTAFSRSHRLTWTTPLLGTWILIAQWVIQGTSLDAGMIANNVATGAVVIALGLAAAGMIRVAIGPRTAAAPTEYRTHPGTPGPEAGTAPGSYAEPGH